MSRDRHCERSEAIRGAARKKAGLLRCARNDDYRMSAPRRRHQRLRQPFPSPKVDYRRTIYASSVPPIKAHPQGTRSHTSHGVERDDCFGGRTSEPRPDCDLRDRLGGPCGDAVLLPPPADGIAHGASASVPTNAGHDRRGASAPLPSLRSSIWRLLSLALRFRRFHPPGEIIGKSGKRVRQRASAVADRLAVGGQGLRDRPDHDRA